MLECIIGGFINRIPGIIAMIAISLAIALAVVAGICFIASLASFELTFGACVLAAALPMLGGVAVGTVFMIISVLADVIRQCLAGGAANVGVAAPGAVTDALKLGHLDCDSARRARDRARADLEAAEQALRLQEDRVRAARTRLDAAIAAAGAAAAAIGIALLNPFAWPTIAALVAVAAVALGVVVQRTTALAQEQARLADLARQLAWMQAQLAAAEALVAVLCQTTPSDPTAPGRGSGTSILEGTLPVGTVGLSAL
jgi:hypothetical protein